MGAQQTAPTVLSPAQSLNPPADLFSFPKGSFDLLLRVTFSHHFIVSALIHVGWFRRQPAAFGVTSQDWGGGTTCSQALTGVVRSPCQSNAGAICSLTSLRVRLSLFPGHEGGVGIGRDHAGDVHRVVASDGSHRLARR